MRFARYYIFIFAALMVVSCGQVNGPEDGNQFRPPVKSETKWLCNDIGGEKLHMVSRKEFDRRGNLLLHVEYDNKGRKVSKSEFTHNDSGRREQRYFFDNSGEITNTKKFIYHINSNGNITKKITLNDDGLMTNEVVYSYDDNGNLIQKTEYNSSGNIDHDIEYKYSYNDDGRIIERIIKSDCGVGHSRDSLIYQQDLNRIEKISFDAAGEIEVIFTYIYNSSGQIKTELVSKPDGEIIRRFIFEYEYYK